MVQKVISTAENKAQQKNSTFYSSSTVFWGVFDRKADLDTSISFVNHFLLKRKISSVTLRLSVRDLSGQLIKELIEEIDQAKAYCYSLARVLPKSIENGEYAIFTEFTSNENLAVPFCAVVMSIESPNTADTVHTYGRAIEVNEINSAIDFKKSYETGWSISPGSKMCNFALLHTGRLHSTISGQLMIIKKGVEIHKVEIAPKRLGPFATLKLDINKLLMNTTDGKEILKEIDESNYGEIDAKVELNGLKGNFPRMLFVTTANKSEKKRATSNKFEFINITHSNFDFDKAEQPKSRISWGYINNPFYPRGVKDCGFRYYPCDDLKELSLENDKCNSLPISITPLSSIKINSSTNLPSRVVGSNWVRWKSSPITGDCSTGTYIIEYNDIKSYWHWGLLSPSSSIYESSISGVNPYSIDEHDHDFLLEIYNEKGIVEKRAVNFTGKVFAISFKAGEIDTSTSNLWYVIKGEGVGSFNVFSTFFFPDLRDGSVEHAF